jgi:hypothetical protein
MRLKPVREFLQLLPDQESFDESARVLSFEFYGIHLTDGFPSL